jgi:hypothetical protein
VLLLELILLIEGLEICSSEFVIAAKELRLSTMSGTVSALYRRLMLPFGGEAKDLDWQVAQAACWLAEEELLPSYESY